MPKYTLHFHDFTPSLQGEPTDHSKEQPNSLRWDLSLAHPPLQDLECSLVSRPSIDSQIPLTDSRYRTPHKHNTTLNLRNRLYLTSSCKTIIVDYRTKE